MKVITTHERADLDALAAMYAASWLYPGYRVVLPVKLNANVRSVLVDYPAELPSLTVRDLPRDGISELLLVDTQAIASLRGLTADTLVRIIDHHPDSKDHPKAVDLRLEPVGATTTILAEELAERGIQLTKLQATLLLAGIYEDTGSLSYLTTTARDVRIVAWLLEAGADLELAAQYLNVPLTAQQRAVLASLLANAEVHSIQGHDVCLASVRLEESVDELAGLVHQVMQLYEPSACFVLVACDDEIQVIARSVTQAVDVASILSPLGGGGHARAAAVLVHERTLSGLAAWILETCHAHILPPTLVRDLMATQVHRLHFDQSAAEAEVLMRRWGHEGFPVVDQDDRLLGMLTRSDVDRALHHRRGDQPIRSLLHTGAVTVTPDEPIEAVRQVMLASHLGQVPVVQEGRLVGIVTRTDLIKLGQTHTERRRVTGLLQQALSPNLMALMADIRDAAQAEGDLLYLVGGFVRDLLLHQPNLDIDLVVEGDAIAVARRLVRVRHGKVTSHTRFGTAKVTFDDPPEGTPAAIDLVTARSEFYESPSVLPQVEWGSIRQDLYRRDFTINTMAICLSANRFGELLDYYGGEADLASGTIRVLHNLSFIEDPTRILRAVRFEQRLGFQIEARTAELVDDAVGLLEHVSGERLRHELYLLLQEVYPEKGLQRLQDLGVLAQLHPALAFDEAKADRMAELRELMAHAAALKPETAYLALLTGGMDEAMIAELCSRLQIGLEDARLLRQVARLRAQLPALSAPGLANSALYQLLKPFNREARALLDDGTADAAPAEGADQA